MNTKFILLLETVDSMNYNFRLISQQPFNGEINWIGSNEYFDSSLKSNQVQSIIGKGKFGSKINSIF